MIILLTIYEIVQAITARLPESEQEMVSCLQFFELGVNFSFFNISI
jgi:hypothetical protein